MHHLLGPGVRLMSALSYRKKFLLVGFVVAIPLFAGIGFSAFYLKGDIENRRHVLALSRLTREMNQVFLSIQQYRGMSNALAMGDFSFAQPLLARRDRIESQMQAISDKVRKAGWAAYEQQWQVIVRRWQSMGTDSSPHAPANWQSYTDMIEDIARLLGLVGGRLLQIPVANPEEFHMVEVSLDHLPQFMEAVGKARDRGAGLLAAGGKDARTRFRLDGLSSRIHSQWKKLQEHLDNMRQELSPPTQKRLVALQERTHRFERRIEQILRHENSSISPRAFFDLGTSVLTEASRLQSAMLSRLIRTSARELHRERIWVYTLLAVASFAILLVGYLALAYYRCITLAIRALADNTEQVKRGDIPEPLQLKITDELGQIIRSFNEVATAMVYVNTRMRAIVDLAVDGIISIDKRGTILGFNPAAEKMFGYAANEVIGKNVTMLMPEQYRLRHTAALKRYVEEGSYTILNQRVEMEGRRKGGTHFTMELSINEVQADIHLFNAFVRDISERKQLESERELLAQVVEQAAEAIVVTDPQGTIRYVNPAFETLNGYTRSEVAGLTPRVLKSGRQPPEFYDELWKTITSGKAWHAEVVNKRKDGSLYHAEHIINPIIDVDGNIVNFVGFQRDITEKVDMQARMEHMQRLESLGVLAGGIAHDFNNFLTVILGNAILARNKCRGRKGEAERHLTQIEASANHAADLCKQLLDYAGKGKRATSLTDMSSLVEDMIMLLETSIARNVRLKPDLAAHLPAIRADEAQIRQAVMNLVTNASDAIGDADGCISVTTGVMDADKAFLADTYTASDLPAGRYVFLKVSDTGCGMDAEMKKRLFDPFFSTKREGRGLGLSAVLGIVHGHRGAIRLHSEKGRGSSFTVLLPVAEQQKAVLSSDHEISLQDWQGTGSVLVVEDEEAIREMAVEMLEEMGFNVLAASDGRDGVARYREHQHEIVAVLLDLSMPGLNGRDVFLELKRINPRVKVIVASGFGENEVVDSLNRMGLDAFIQKPYSPQSLKQIIQRVLHEEVL